MYRQTEFRQQGGMGIANVSITVALHSKDISYSFIVQYFEANFWAFLPCGYLKVPKVHFLFYDILKGITSVINSTHNIRGL